MPCKGCREGKEAFLAGYRSRRSFIGGVLGLVAATKIRAYRAITGDSDIPYELALGLSRVIFGIQVGFLNTHGKYQPLSTVLGPEGLLKHKAHASGRVMAGYMNVLDVTSTEIIPGWELDYEGDDTYFRFSLIEKNKTRKIAIINEATLTDGGPIWAAWTDGSHPKMKDLGSAKEFPGAVNYLDLPDSPLAVLSPSTRVRIRNAAYGLQTQQQNCSHCPGFGCTWCVNKCCAMICTQRFPPAPNWCWFQCGSDKCPIAYEQQLCSICNTCANYWSACCTCGC